MEGVVYSLADCNEILKKLGTEVVSMRACGVEARKSCMEKDLWQIFINAMYIH